jgi:hypothetical protein
VTVDQASRQIEAILAELEREIGATVEAVEIDRVECTSYSDSHRRYKRILVLKLAPTPEEWAR